MHNAMKLYVRVETAKSKLLFEKEEEIEFDVGDVLTLVQTDKAIYKPGDTVHYRIIIVDSNLMPVQDTVTVKILNPKNFCLSQQSNITLLNGVYSDNFELAHEVPLGVWKIEISTRTDVTAKSFTVKKYVLPRFAVTVSASSVFGKNDDLTVFVQAKYTYGKNVAGKADVFICSQYTCHFDLADNEEVDGIAKRTVRLANKGETPVVFSSDELRKLGSEHYVQRSIEVMAIVYEDLTNIKRNDTIMVTLYDNKFKLDIKKSVMRFVLGKKYSVVINLRQSDGTPIKPTPSRKVQVAVLCQNQTDMKAKFLYDEIISLNPNGSAVFTTKDNIYAEELIIQGKYDSKGIDDFINADVYSSISIYSPSTRYGSELTVQLNQNYNEVLYVGSKVSFAVESGQTLEMLTYQVVAHGSILFSEVLHINSRTTEISFTASPQMVPRAKVIVHSVLSKSTTIQAAFAEFEVQKVIKNNVSLSIDRMQAEPGDKVHLKIKTAPHSYVGLLAVDQSVLLMKSNNDITEDTIKMAFKKDASLSLWGNHGVNSIFKSAGLILLSNIDLDSFYFPVQIASRGYGGGIVYASRPVSYASGSAEKQYQPMSKGVGSGSMENYMPLRTRSVFPETWIWAEMTSNNDGEAVYEATAPDTITSWIASAFGVSSRYGLGIAPTTSKLTTFRPFFIRLDLPYSVKRGEKLALEILVFNYLNTEQLVTVTLKHDENAGFDFLQKDGTKKPTIKAANSRNYNSRQVSVPGGGTAKAVYFPIVLTRIGNVKLSVVARSAQAGDAVAQPLKVEPEGYRIDRNVPFIVSLSDGNKQIQFSKKIDLEFPSDTVEGSEFARVDVSGDLLGPVIVNIGSLVRMPSGCGEQNMIGLVPNIVVLRYLKAINYKDAKITVKALNFMRKGYQTELTFRRSDNSFSAFGQADEHGSTWLTAFVVRSFKQAQEFIFVDDKLLNSSVAFLIAQQQNDGSFGEVGIVHDFKGDLPESGLALTAYVFLSLLENGVKNDKAQHYLEKHVNNINKNLLTASLVTYALHLANSSKKEIALRSLEKWKVETSGTSFLGTHLANKKKRVTEGLHWSEKLEVQNSTDAWYQPRPTDIQSTAYVLLTYCSRNDFIKASSVSKWLISHRNALGGWSSTQDTVVALQALATYGEKIYSSALNAKVTLKNGADRHSFAISSKNSMTFQSYELTNFKEPVELLFEGQGNIIGQVQYFYYEVHYNGDDSFACTKKIQETNGSRLSLTLCCNYTEPGLTSNMAVAEVRTLTGYRFDTDDIDGLTKVDSVQRTELEKDETKINIYFNSLGNNPVCLTLNSNKMYQVVGQKPAEVVLYDYYDPEKRVKFSYTANHSYSEQAFCPECW